MKLRHLINGVILAGIGYKLYQKRQTISTKVAETKTTLQQGQVTLNDIQIQRQNLTESLTEMKDLSNNLSYKLRVFEQESKPHLQAIKDIITKYQQ